MTIVCMIYIGLIIFFVLWLAAVLAIRVIHKDDYVESIDEEPPRCEW